ncbi:MAG: alpha/beta hydrolase [Mobilitalea sp.]
MKEHIRSFKKIIPYLREETWETIQKHPIYGEKIEVPVGDDSVDVYLHPTANHHAPVLFELHGGGFVLGHAAKDDALCEYIKDKRNLHVVGINYRKAPEYAYPGAIEDVMGVMKYFAKNADQYGMDCNKFVVMGFSAGANLATVIAMKAKNNQDFHIACQILHYPFLDAVANPYEKGTHPADMPCEIMEAFNELYSPEEDRGLPWISPIFASSDLLENSAPAIIVTAKEDALCAEGLLYGEKLKEAGVSVDCMAMEFAHHGYIEDYFNQFCFENLPEETKASFHNRFGKAAEEAIQFTMTHLDEYLK